MHLIHKQLIPAIPYRCAKRPGGRRLVAAFMLLANAILAPSPGSTAAALPSTPAPPIRAGERMLYQVEWNPPWYLFFLPVMEAGTVELSMSGMLDYQDKKAVKLVFAAHSSGTLAKLFGFKIDDYYESLTDPENFCSYKVTKREREGQRKRDIEIVYMKESRRLHIRDYDVSVNPPLLKKAKFVEDVPACVQDYISALYSLRQKKIETGAVVHSVVGEYENYMDLEARMEQRERVDTPAGRYDTYRINVVALRGGLFRGGGQFKVWMTADERRIPVQFEVKAAIGKVTGKLKNYSSTVDFSGTPGKVRTCDLRFRRPTL